MKRAWQLLGILVFVGVADAMTVQGTPPAVPNTGAAPKFASIQAPTRASDDSSGMRKGTIETVNVSKGTFHVHGQGLNFDAKRIKVFRGGKPASIGSLRKGSAVRFTLDPADPQHRRVAAIYVD